MNYRQNFLCVLLNNINITNNDIEQYIPLFYEDIELSVDSKYIYINECKFPIQTNELKNALYHAIRCHFFRSVEKNKIGSVIASDYKYSADFDTSEEIIRMRIFQQFFDRNALFTLQKLQFERLKLINEDKIYTKTYSRLNRVYSLLHNQINQNVMNQ